MQLYFHDQLWTICLKIISQRICDNSLTMSEGDSFNINLDDGVSGVHFRSQINSIFLLHSAFPPGSILQP